MKVLLSRFVFLLFLFGWAPAVIWALVTGHPWLAGALYLLTLAILPLTVTVSP